MTSGQSDPPPPGAGRPIGETATGTADLPLATVLPGAHPFNLGNVSRTFRGLVLTVDGTTRLSIIKDLPARELANEILGHLLAKEIGLPVPEAYLAVAPTGTIDAELGPETEEGERLVFATADVGTPSVQFVYRNDAIAGTALVKQLAAWTELGRLYAFDSWVGNIDRNAGNLLFAAPDTAHLIDHGQILGGPTWDASSLDASSELRNRLGEWLTPYLSTEQVDVAKGEASRTEAALRSVDKASQIEAAGVASLTATEDADAAVKFLEDRSVLVSYYSNKALGAPTVV